MNESPVIFKMNINEFIFVCKICKKCSFCFCIHFSLLPGQIIVTLKKKKKKKNNLCNKVF